MPKAFRYPFEGDVPPQYEASARTAFFDSVVERHLADISQFVILGAGFDTGAFRLPNGPRVRAVEVDTPKTQAVKRDVLEKSGIDSSRVTLVAADFAKEDWLARLAAVGFAPSRPAVFLWEGVTMYLERAAVEATLRKIAGPRREAERREHQDDADVHHQPLPEPVPEEQDVHADHDGYQREHVKDDGWLSSHPPFLLRVATDTIPAAAPPSHATMARGDESFGARAHRRVRAHLEAATEGGLVEGAPARRAQWPPRRSLRLNVR